MFDLFKKKNNSLEGGLQSSLDSQIRTSNNHEYETSRENDKQTDGPDTEIPDRIFVEYDKPKPKVTMEPIQEKEEINDLRTLYQFLEQNLERKGYEDALTNPDTSYMEEHMIFIQNDLNLAIAKVKNYYSGYLRKINFHIETRKRNGMIETVDELLTHKDTIEDEIKAVSSVEEDSKKGIGLSQNLSLSYRKGFRNGFAAITYNNVLGRKD